MATETFCWCSQFGHFSKDYVGKGVAQKPLVLARVYTLVPRELKGGSKVVTGTTPILEFEALVLFNSGVAQSFVSVMFIRLSRLVVRTLEPGLAVTTLVWKTMVYKRVVYKCGRVLPANLIVLPMFSYDVILGMDWLVRHSVIIDYA